jgi:hypothetical protein
MRTTVRLDEHLLDLARREAARRSMTLTALIEHGLRLALRKPQRVPQDARVVLPVSHARGGLMAGVDLDDSAALLDRMDGLA